MSRLRTVFRYARAKEFLVNRAVIEEAVIILGENRKLAKPSLALPWSDVPAFYASLLDNTPTQLALRLLILTGVRADSVNNMQLDQIRGPVWEIPPLHVKGRVDSAHGFDVPLSRGALHVIELAKADERKGYPASLGQGNILERPKPHLSLPTPELKAKDPLCASVSALMKPQTLPIAVFPGREGLEFCNCECVRFCHDNILFVIYVLA